MPRASLRRPRRVSGALLGLQHHSPLSVRSLPSTSTMPRTALPETGLSGFLTSWSGFRGVFYSRVRDWRTGGGTGQALSAPTMPLRSGIRGIRRPPAPACAQGRWAHDLRGSGAALGAVRGLATWIRGAVRARRSGAALCSAALLTCGVIHRGAQAQGTVRTPRGALFLFFDGRSYVREDVGGPISFGNVGCVEISSRGFCVSVYRVPGDTIFVDYIFHPGGLFI